MDLAFMIGFNIRVFFGAEDSLNLWSMSGLPFPPSLSPMLSRGHR